MRSAKLAVSLAWLVLVVSVLAMRAPVAQEKSQEAEKPAQAEPAKPLEIPEEEKARKNPVEPTAESVEAGRKLFVSQCAMCHGAKGDGQGDLAQELKLTPPDFTKGDPQKKRTDGELFYVITAGHDKMPAQGSRLRDLQKWNLVNFIRSLARANKTPEKK